MVVVVVLVVVGSLRGLGPSLEGVESGGWTPHFEFLPPFFDCCCPPGGMDWVFKGHTAGSR